MRTNGGQRGVTDGEWGGAAAVKGVAFGEGILRHPPTREVEEDYSRWEGDEEGLGT